MCVSFAPQCKGNVGLRLSGAYNTDAKIIAIDIPRKRRGRKLPEGKVSEFALCKVSRSLPTQKIVPEIKKCKNLLEVCMSFIILFFISINKILPRNLIKKQFTQAWARFSFRRYFISECVLGRPNLWVY